MKHQQISLWEILVPTVLDGKPIRTRYHRVWDRFVRNLSGGLTILTPIKGQWLSDINGLQVERMIPVRIACTDDDMDKIINHTIKYYKQEAVMAYKISDHVIIRNKNA